MEETSKKRWFKVSVSLILTILLFIITIAFTGLFSLVEGKFNTDIWNDPQFWNKLTISAMINLFSMLGVIVYLLPEQSNQNKKVIEREKVLLEANATTDVYEFEKFVIDENITRKKKTYLKQLDKQKRSYIKKYKPTLADKKAWHSGSKEEKESNEFCIKMLEFEYLSSEQYMNDNLIYMDLKYPEITSAMILSNNMATQGGMPYVHRTWEKTMWWMVQLFIKYTSSLGLPAVWAATIIDGFRQPTQEFWLDFAVRMVGMLLSIVNGIWSVNSYTQQFTIPDLDLRISLTRRFAIWKKKAS